MNPQEIYNIFEQMFCSKFIVISQERDVKEIMEARKQYVEVIVQFREDGLMLPRTILWEDGRRFPVDRIIDVSPAPALKAGGQGDRYIIQVGGKICYLFFEHSCDCDVSEKLGRWFVEAIQ